MKKILITGSTDGIGKLAAIKLANDGHEIILHGRNSEKLKHTISEMKIESNNQNISGFVADFSDFSSVQKMITQISESYTSIDVLINNAGVFKSVNSQNKNGLDLRFVVNYLTPYLLTNGLLPLLQKAISSRVINLSSAAQSSVQLEALSGNNSISTQEAYAQSKLALTIWSFVFAHANPRITTIAVNPGSLLNTNMVKEAYGQYWSSADKGAKILYELSTLDVYSKSNGEYFDNDAGNFSKAHPEAYDLIRIQELMLETEKIINNHK